MGVKSALESAGSKRRVLFLENVIFVCLNVDFNNLKYSFQWSKIVFPMRQINLSCPWMVTHQLTYFFRTLMHFHLNFTNTFEICRSYLRMFPLCPLGGHFLGFFQKKRKVLRILWFGEKVDQKNFQTILPSGGSRVRRPGSEDPHRR